MIDSISYCDSPSIKILLYTSAREIDLKLMDAMRMHRERMREIKNEKQRAKLRNRRRLLRQLVFSRFSRRIIDKTYEHPRGRIALTLAYGKERAKEFCLAVTGRDTE
jgi:hypothetical protein